MPDKDNSSLYLETKAARTATQQTDYDSLSMLVNALLAGYLEGKYDPWNDFDAENGWGNGPRHTWEEVEAFIEQNNVSVPADEGYIGGRFDDMEKRIDRLERIVEKETGIPPNEY